MEIKKNLFTFRTKLTPIKTVKKLVMHHPAANWTAERTHDFHKYSRGWLGIGYNYFIEKDGTIKEGRGLNQGAHAVSYNHNTLGISFSGNFENELMTDAQVRSGIELLTYLIKKFNLTADDIIGHKEIAKTACPGKNFRMNELKEGVKKALNSTDNSSLKKGDKGAAVKTLQENLLKLGYQLPKFGADSDFGNETETAVKQFQKNNNLTIDGIARETTIKKINENLKELEEKKEKENLKKEIEKLNNIIKDKNKEIILLKENEIKLKKAFIMELENLVKKYK